MFSRNKSDAPTTDQADAEATTAPAGKGRPTPKRRTVEAANKRPLVPNDRKAAAKAARDKRREMQDRQYQAMQTGDERYMPVRDKGPVKRYIRDFVDARWNAAEFFLPGAFVLIAATMLVARWFPVAGALMVFAPYVLLLVALVDSFFMWRKLKARLVAKFGESPKGSAWYAIMRTFQLRRLRMPKPMEPKHGVYPS